jgi:hypothetical protein
MAPLIQVPIRPGIRKVLEPKSISALTTQSDSISLGAPLSRQQLRQYRPESRHSQQDAKVYFHLPTSLNTSASNL